jgi:hypothetical protein
MDVDVEKICARCGRPYWWTVEEQEDCDNRGVMPLRRCANCSGVARERATSDTLMLARQVPSPAAMSFPQLQQPLITPDIRRLIAEASAPIEDRGQTFLEWIEGENPRKKQLARKTWAHQAANALVKERIELMGSIAEIANRTDAFRRARLEAELAALELEDQIAERRVLRTTRLATASALEAEKQRTLLNPAPTPQSDRDQAIQHHRDALKAKADAKRGALADLLASVRDVFESGASDEQRATEIRELLHVYKQPDTVLSPKVRRFLEFAETEDEP